MSSPSVQRADPARCCRGGVLCASSHALCVTHVPQATPEEPKAPEMVLVDEWYDSALCICLFCIDEEVSCVAGITTLPSYGAA